MDIKREFLRHTVATLAYRGGKAVQGVLPNFSGFRVGEKTRTPGEILAHISDLLDWALWLAKGENRGQNSKPLPWEQEVARFFRELEKFDSYLASDEPLGFPAEKLFQGPIADALTHIGQIGMLRRLSEGPVRGENYFKADIVIGRVGSEQSTKRFEFD